jgi:hypothetical protein
MVASAYLLFYKIAWNGKHALQVLLILIELLLFILLTKESGLLVKSNVW